MKIATQDLKFWQNEPAAVIATALGCALAWAAICFVSTERAAVAAALPPSIVGALGCLLILVACAQGKSWAVASLLVFVIFGLSLSLRVREYGDTGLDWQNGVKLLTWVLIPMLCILNWRRLAPFFNEPTIKLAIAYSFIALASAAWSLTPAYTAANAMGLTAYLLLMCLSVAALGPSSCIRLITITLTVYIGLALVAGAILPQMAWLSPAGTETGYRLRGLSGHPNVLGEQAALLVTFAVIAKRQGLIGRKIFILGLLLGFTTLILTDSRTTTIATIIAWGVVACRSRRLLGPLFAGGVLVAIAAALMMATGTFPNLTSLAGPLARSGSASEIVTLTGRTELWQVAGDLIAQKPILGWGFNGTEALIVGSVGRGFIGDPVNAHNMYIQTVLSLGIVGSLPAFGFLGILIWRMATQPDAARDQLVLLVMIIGVAEVSIFSTPVLLNIAFFFALARDAQARRQRKTTPPLLSSVQELSTS